MTTRHTTQMPTHVAPRRRSSRAVRLLDPLTETRAAAATDDAAEAERLVDDLLALVDAGLVTITTDPGAAARYEIADDSASTAV
ncbi:hypothetical protein NBH00_18490 [Paraconexibacter antarcticus]|uniref:Uncharacterized protein n=1 Tax=Paraconexibacter antarcticus TaxID=2949664 RepID=A0ABY5DR97_9ACTN|nr:hypothetical protein [Paraconexibacter antarcticus]UTI63332.1 hypothetical protein NBH00_18490 [Paraconexibacter antarcticus]